MLLLPPRWVQPGDKSDLERTRVCCLRCDGLGIIVPSRRGSFLRPKPNAATPTERSRRISAGFLSSAAACSSRSGARDRTDSCSALNPPQRTSFAPRLAQARRGVYPKSSANRISPTVAASAGCERGDYLREASHSIPIDWNFPVRATTSEIAVFNFVKHTLRRSTSLIRIALISSPHMSCQLHSKTISGAPGREDPDDPIHGVPDINLNGKTVPMGSGIANPIGGDAAARGLADSI